MRSRIFMMLLAIAVVASSASAAQAGRCGSSTIRGTYAFTIHGTILVPNGPSLLLDGVAKTTYDGSGNLTQVDAVATNGVMAPGWRPGTGTYFVSADCTGFQTIVIPGMPDLHLRIIVAQSGNTIHQVVVDPGIATTAEGERVTVRED